MPISTLKARAYKVTEDWYESTVSWNNDGFGGAWNTYGGTHESTKYSSPEAELPENVGNWTEFDVSYAFKSHFANNDSDYQLLYQQITEVQSGRHYFNPTQVAL